MTATGLLLVPTLYVGNHTSIRDLTSLDELPPIGASGDTSGGYGGHPDMVGRLNPAIVTIAPNGTSRALWASVTGGASDFSNLNDLSTDQDVAKTYITSVTELPSGAYLYAMEGSSSLLMLHPNDAIDDTTIPFGEPSDHGFEPVVVAASRGQGHPASFDLDASGNGRWLDGLDGSTGMDTDGVPHVCAREPTRDRCEHR